MATIKVGPFNVRAIPDLDMTETELIAQLVAVGEAGEATEYFSDDELEAWLVSGKGARHGQLD